MDELRHGMVRLLGVVTAVLLVGCLGVGWWRAQADRVQSLHAARRLPVEDGRVVFEVPAVPNTFLRYAAARIPPGDPVEYIPAELPMCGPGPRQRTWWPRLLWAQYRLAPRPMACGAAARWRVYLGYVPPDVPAADRWSATFAVVRVGSA